MKKDHTTRSLFFTTLSAALLMFGNTVTSPVQAQLLKELGQRIKNRSKEKVFQTADETADGGIEVITNKGSTAKNSAPVFSPAENKAGTSMGKANN